MDDCGKTAVLIPAFDPDEKLLQLVDALLPRFTRILVVDDGSVSGKEIFPELERRGCEVAVHAVNRGKGAALKTGLKRIAERWPDCPCAVTADADGQHRPDDIVRVAEASCAHPDRLVIGVRAFSGDVPFRSRFGNWWTRLFFRLLTGLEVSDTQTGLRGIPAALSKRTAAIAGERYEYEMLMLADSRNHAGPPVEVPIATVYIDGNASSHFQPMRDTFRIYGALLRFLTAPRFTRPSDMI